MSLEMDISENAGLNGLDQDHFKSLVAQVMVVIGKDELDKAPCMNVVTWTVDRDGYRYKVIVEREKLPDEAE
jgi:hypothetical protein